MQVTTADSPKRSRAKAPAAAATPKPSVDPPAPADLSDMIATTAYFLAEERDFTPGHELDDWLEAERRVRALVDG
jgi:Protein of unknown function (DUF2934)